jgi:ABC-type multidrug transport system fused ATPase/permease subunit
MIAHRLSTIRNCDKIFHLFGGTVTDSGTFQDLKQRVPEFEKQAKLMGL